MFNALDHLNGFQLILVLSPIMVIMTFIRWREDKAQSLKFEDLNRLQKGWIFLSFLSPGLSARVLTELSDEDRVRLMEAGSELRGSAGPVAYQVLQTFYQADGAKDAPSKDIDEVCRYLNLRFDSEPKKLAGLYRSAYL